MQRARCPICARPSALDHTPFCSQRCRTIDLGSWLDGDYRVPTEEPAVGVDRPLDGGVES